MNNNTNMEDIKRVVSALTSLIRHHQKRIDTYLSLAETRSHDEIQSLCMHHADVSMQMIANLSKWRSAYGGFAQKQDRSDGTDIWYEARLFFSFNRGKVLFSRCTTLDKEMLKLYRLTIPLMPAAAVGDLQSQVKSLERMMLDLQECSEQKQVVGALATR